MAKRRFWAQVVVVAVVGLFLVGCGADDGKNRKPISGKVTVNGTPVPTGSISFEPLYQGGLSAGAVITNGDYSISKEQGLPPGKYLVQITGQDANTFAVSPGKMPGDEEMPAIKQWVPKEWNDSKQEVEVKDSGENKFDFPIQAK